MGKIENNRPSEGRQRSLAEYTSPVIFSFISSTGGSYEC